MINFFREQSRAFYGFLLVIIGVSFSFFGVASIPQLGGGSDVFGKIQGHNVHPDVYNMQNAGTEVIFALQARNNPRARLSELERDYKTWQRLLLLNEAKKIGLDADPDQVRLYIRRIFSNSAGVFDPQALNDFRQVLERKGVSDDRFESIVREEIIATKMRDAIVSPAQLTKEEADAWFKKTCGATKVKLIKFTPENVPAPAAPSDAKIAEYYEFARKIGSAFMTQKQYQIAYAYIPYRDGYDKLTEQQKTEARLETMARTEKFMGSVAGEPGKPAPDFEAASKAEKFRFGVTELSPAPSLPADLPQSQAFAFHLQNLSTTNPYEKVMTDGGYFVIKLVKLEEPRRLTVEEARPQIIEMLTSHARNSAMETQGKSAAALLRSLLTGGTPFDKAAEMLKLKVENLPEYVPVDNNITNFDIFNIRQEVWATDVGRATGYFAPQDMPGIGYIAYVESRKEPEAATRTTFDNALLPSLRSLQRNIAFDNWQRMQLTQADTRLPYALRAENLNR
ncbi:hypothetical protein DB346_03265 [Verrucomicrobia bacterium LW23]|nr:hypothetical protein DB346_03265 [Verrucomicrobia bacterium LW23]